MGAVLCCAHCPQLVKTSTHQTPIYTSYALTVMLRAAVKTMEA